MISSTMNLTINTDGGARGNPGPAGIGVVIADDADSALRRYLDGEPALAHDLTT